MDSGITWLVRKVLTDLPLKSQYPVPMLSVNLRAGSYSYIRYNLVDSLSAWLEKMKESTESVSIGPMSGVPSKSPVDDLNHLLLRSISHNYKPASIPILFIYR